MKITTILGSPHHKGNTAAVLDSFESMAALQHEIRRINITDYAVNGCLGCNVCQMKADQPGCAQKDDAAAILNQLIDSDLILYATPLYGWSFTAQMKALLDRHYSLMKWYAPGKGNSLLKDRRIALLVTCAGPVENNADLVLAAFDRQVDYLQCENAGKFVLPFSTNPDQMQSRVEETALAMAGAILPQPEQI
jgi:NAD(P)H-dependent FMN reductase